METNSWCVHAAECWAPGHNRRPDRGWRAGPEGAAGKGTRGVLEVLGWPSPPLEDYSPGELYQRGCSSWPWGASCHTPFPLGTTCSQWWWSPPTVQPRLRLPTMVLGPPQSHGIFPWGFKVPTGALRAGEGLTLPAWGAVCLHPIEGAAPYPPRAPPRLSPDPLERPEPQASESPGHTGCFLPLGPRPGHRCGGTLVPGGPRRGWGPPAARPQACRCYWKGAGCMCPRVSRPQVGMTFQAEYQPQGEKRGRAKGLMASPWGNPPPGKAGSSDLTRVPEMHRVGSGPPLHLLG